MVDGLGIYISLCFILIFLAVWQTEWLRWWWSE